MELLHDEGGTGPDRGGGNVTQIFHPAPLLAVIQAHYQHLFQISDTFELPLQSRMIWNQQLQSNYLESNNSWSRVELYRIEKENISINLACQVVARRSALILLLVHY